MTRTARYSGRDFVCVLRAACLLPVLYALLRIRPGYVLRRSPHVAADNGAAPPPERVVRAVRLASRIVGGSCLARALVSRMLLARAGVPVTLVLGVAELGGAPAVRAHAWVEHRGIPVVDGEPAPAFPAVWRIVPHAAR